MEVRDIGKDCHTLRAGTPKAQALSSSSDSDGISAGPLASEGTAEDREKAVVQPFGSLDWELHSEDGGLEGNVL